MARFGRRAAVVIMVALLLAGGLPWASALAATSVTVDFTVDDRTYDGTTDATITGCTLLGVVAPDLVACDFSSASASFLNPAAGNARPVSGSGFVLTGADAVGYAIGLVHDSAADIGALSLTVIGITAADKVYDGSAAATIDASGAALVGVLPGDLGGVTLDVSGASGTFVPDGSMGPGRTVQVAGVAIGGPASGSYQVTQPTTTASITPGAATRLVLSAALIQVAGTHFSVTVTAKDAEGNTATLYTGTVHFATTDVGNVTLPSDFTFTGDDNGSHEFTNGATLVTAGSQTITVSDSISGSIAGTSGPIVVNPGAPTKLAFVTQPGGAAATSLLSPQPVIEVQDASGNRIDATSSVTIAIVTNPGSGALSGTATVGAAAGRASFTDLSISRAGIGYVFGASDGALATVVSDPFTITGGLPQAVTFGPLRDRTYGDAAFTVSAIGGSSVPPVTFSSATTNVCTATGPDGTTVTMIAVGTCIIDADQAGDATYAAAATVPQAFVVAKREIAIAADPKVVTYGSPDPTFTFTYGSFVGSDGASSIDAPPTCAPPGPHFDVLGSPYPISCTGGLDDSYGFSYVDGALTVQPAETTIDLAASVSTFETNVPVTFTATIPRVGAGAIPTGTVIFRVSGFADVETPLVSGVATTTVAFPSAGGKSVQVLYNGNANYTALQKSLAPTVLGNQVAAAGVGVSATSIYPYRDTWRDTIIIRGTRTEPLSGTIRIYRPTGSLLLTSAIAVGAGPYSYTWKGRTASGAILPPGIYRVVQTLSDPSSTPALAKSWTSYVTLSPKRMYWTTVTLYVKAGPRNFAAPGDRAIKAQFSTTKTGPLVMSNATTASAWKAVGYQFSLPAASTYASISFQVRGSWTGTTAPKVGLIPWNGGNWLSMYSPTRARVGLGRSSTSYYAQTLASLGGIVSGRSIRASIDSFSTPGGYSAGPFRYSITSVRLVVRYGILK